MKEGN